MEIKMIGFQDDEPSIVHVFWNQTPGNAVVFLNRKLPSKTKLLVRGRKRT